MTGYLYDADGTRIAKGSITAWSCDPTANGFNTTNDYILGLGGEQLTEMGVGGANSANPANSSNSALTWQHANIWAGGKLLGTYDNDGLHFYLDDPLGTRRAQTNYAGVLEQTCQSLPYGDSLTCVSQPDPGGNISPYIASLTAPTEHHFTGKERDAESGNDYFGARYYASTMGRWLSPDWSVKVEPIPYAKLGNPQTLNLYAYMQNNPLSGTDPDGHCDWCQKAWNRVFHGEAKTNQERAQPGVNNDIALVRSKVTTEEKTGFTIVEWTPVETKNLKDGKVQGGLPSPDPKNDVVLWESEGGSSYESQGKSQAPGIGHDTISSGKGGMYPQDVDQRWSVNGNRVRILVGFDDAGKPILAWQIHYDRSGDSPKMTTK